MSKISQNDLARYVVIQLKAGGNITKLAEDIAKYLVANRRSRELAAIMRKVTAQRQIDQNIIEANVTSAHELSPQTLSKIKSLLGESNQVILNKKIDPSVLGGFRVESADQGIDLTVQHQIKQLRQLIGVSS